MLFTWIFVSDFVGVFFTLLLRSRSPVGEVHRCVFEQSGEDEHEATDEVDVDGFDVADSWEGAADSRADRCHGQHSCYTCSEKKSELDHDAEP